MVKEIKAKKTSSGRKIAIVVSEFNEFITQRLLDGCLDELKKLKVKSSDITVAWVPGAYEIPVVARKFAKKKDIAAVICLGCVIRGGTFHFELICQGVTQGTSQVAIETGKPVIFGVLSTNTVKQAQERALEKGDNKGRDSAAAAVEMINVLSAI